MADMHLTFLGTNGWYATPVANTVCALIETEERYIVLDAGDGIWRLDKYVKDNRPIDLFLSHFHLDHTIGLHIQPKFRLMKNKFRIFGQPGAKEVLSRLVEKPFSASFDLLKSAGFDASIVELYEGENKLEGYSVTCAPLVHADPCWGYRFEFANKKILTYCTDTGMCDNLVKLSRGADVLITECSFLPGEPASPSWPHLNPEMGAEVAKEAGVKKLFLTHFAANKYETKEMRLGAQEAARKIFPNTTAAMDEMRVEF